jgi:2-polyprenyl-6-methoxyphenol hydroxylase-like FAD-dependent oxidoreductase
MGSSSSLGVGGRARLAVAGGGIGGLALNAALANDARFELIVLERSQRAMSGGAAIILWGNAVAALREMGLGPKIREASVELEQSEFFNRSNVPICSLPIGDWSRRAGAPTVVIRRADLISILASRLAPGSLRMGRAFRAYAQDERGVHVELDDRSSLTVDGLVGADGLRSAVRAQTTSGDEPQALPYEAWVGICGAAPAELHGGRSVAWLGEGPRFCAARLTRGAAFWYATINTRSHQPESRAELLELYRSWPSPVLELIAGTGDADLIRSPIFDRQPSLHWGSGKVTLVGDAAHPATPDLGQGACQAVEGALVLARCLEKAASIEEAFREYERLRMPRVATINKLCRLTWASSAVESKVLCAARDAAMRYGLPSIADKQLRWILAGQGLARV